jgi:potassium-transporting ATPase KdpC subunit
MRLIRDALLLLVVLSVVTGLAYPLAVTGLARLIFPVQAGGSLISSQGHVIGSRLIGQPFQSPGYLWSRPSATSPEPYNAALSSGSNLGPLNPELAAAVASRIQHLRQTSGADSTRADSTRPVPIDLVTTSGSGLDPHLSPAGAFYQLKRIAAARGVTEGEIRQVIQSHLEPRQWGILGEPRVNVLAVNLDLDQRWGRPAPR